MHRLFPRAMRAGALAVAASLVLAATITVAIPNATRRIVEEITAMIPAPAPAEDEPLAITEQLA